MLINRENSSLSHAAPCSVCAPVVTHLPWPQDVQHSPKPCSCRTDQENSFYSGFCWAVQAVPPLPSPCSPCHASSSGCCSAGFVQLIISMCSSFNALQLSYGINVFASVEENCKCYCQFGVGVRGCLTVVTLFLISITQHSRDNILPLHNKSFSRQGWHTLKSRTDSVVSSWWN